MSEDYGALPQPDYTYRGLRYSKPATTVRVYDEKLGRYRAATPEETARTLAAGNDAAPSPKSEANPLRLPFEEEEGYHRSAFLPMRIRTDTGESELATPGFLADPLRAALKIGAAFKGDLPPEEVTYKDIIDATGAVGGGGIALSSGRAPRGSLGMFVGPRAQLPEAQENLRRFLERSAVKTESGDPLRVYTGTSKDKEFNVFNTGRRGSWFSENPELASSYAMDNDSMKLVRDLAAKNAFRYKEMNTASRVIPAYLNIEKPYRLSQKDIDLLNSHPNYARMQAELFDRLRAKGYDGVDFGDGTWVAFNPNQIKSAIGNTGAFDPRSKDIMKAKGGRVEGFKKGGEVMRGLEAVQRGYADGGSVNPFGLRGAMRYDEGGMVDGGFGDASERDGGYDGVGPGIGGDPSVADDIDTGYLEGAMAPVPERSLMDRALGYAYERTMNALENPISTALNVATSFTPFGPINALSNVLGGPTVGSVATAAGRGVGEALGIGTPGVASMAAPSTTSYSTGGDSRDIGVPTMAPQEPMVAEVAPTLAPSYISSKVQPRSPSAIYGSLGVRRPGNPFTYAEGGYVPGKSGGMDDDVPAIIDGKQPAKLSSGEFVFDAATVAALGDGNNAAGARKLDGLRKAIRKKAYGHEKQPPKNYSVGDLVRIYDRRR